MFGGVKRQYWSCGGETVLKKSQFNQDVANHRQDQRVKTDLLAQFQQSILDAGQPQKPVGFMNQVANTFKMVAQNIMRVLAQPMVLIKNIAANLAKMLSQAGNNVKNAMNTAKEAVKNVLTFFFGRKKMDKTEEDKERDNKNYFKKSDLFDDNKVNEGEKSMLGQG